MDAVIAGGDGISSAGNGYISIGMKGIIGSVQGKGAAGDYQLCRGFQTLGTGLVRAGICCIGSGGISSGIVCVGGRIDRCR